MKPRILSIVRLSFPLATAIAALLAAPSASAVVYYWDGTTSTANADGGVGTWNTSTANWDTLATAGADIAWTNGNQAVFAGTAGTVTLGAAITVSGNTATSGGAAMYFATSGYIVGGTNSISTTAASTFRLNNTTFQSGVSLALGLDRTLTLNITGTTNSIAGVISGTGSSGLTIANTGTLTLSNPANTYTGLTIIGNNTNDITLRVTKLANLSQASSLGAPTTAANGVITIGNSSNPGTLELVNGTTASVTNRQVRIGGNNNGGGNATIVNNNTDPTHSLVFTNAAFNLSNATTGSNRTLTLGGANAGANEIQGAIINNNNLVGVTVTGSGAWKLSGNNTYDSATVVAGTATLTLSGDNSGAAGGVTASTATTVNSPRLNVNSATALGTGTLTFGGGLSTDTVRLDNTSVGLVSVSTNNVFNLNRDFTFIGTQSLNLGNMTTTLGGLASGTSRNITVTANTLTFGGTIGQAAANLGVNKLGAGTLVFSGTNTYTGNTTISGGVLQLGNASALGFGARQTTATGNTTVNSGFTLDLNGASTINEPIILSGTGIGGNGALINSGAAVSIGNGVAGIQLPTATTGSGYSAVPTVTITGTGTLATATATLGVTGLSFTAFNGGDKVYTVAPTVTISGGGGIGATATAILSGGATGTLTGFTITNAGSGFTTAPTVTFGNGTFSSGTLNGSATGNATEFTVSGVSMTAAGSGYTGTPTYSFSGGNAVAGTATLSSVTLAADSSVGGSGNTTIDAVVSESGGARSLTKLGAGTLTLTGANGYTGATLVSAGTLTLASAGDINSSSGITVNGSGAKFLQTSSVAATPTVTLTQGTLTGSGTVNTVNVGAGTGGIISNNNGVAGAALTIGNLTLAGAANLNLFSNSFSSTLDVTGTLTTAATPAILTANNVGGWTNGTAYTLMTFGGGSIAGSGDNFTKVINNLGTRQSGTWNTTSSAITLTLAGDSLVWSGANSGNWITDVTDSPTSGTPNWALKNALTATDFWLGDAAEFNDTYDIGGGPLAPTTTTVNISAANVSPASTTFNNSAVNYTLSGAFGIATGSLIKNGSGTVTISTANTFSGTTTISGGILNANSTAALGDGSATNTLIFSGGTLQAGGAITSPVARTVTLTSTGVIDTNGNAVSIAGLMSGAGGLTKNGAGTLTLSGANTFTGTTTLSAGTLAITSTGVLANTAIGVSNAGSTLSVTPLAAGTVNLGNVLTVGAGASLNLGSGTIFSMVNAAAGGTTNLVQEGTFATDALTLNGVTLNFELSGATADKLAVTGALATASVSGVNTINLTTLAALTAGTYDLITTANVTGGLDSGGASAFAFASGLATGVAGFGGTNYLLTLNNAANRESVTVAAAPSAMTWTGQTLGNGATDANWNTGASTNWALGATPVGYANGNAVTFQDTNTVATGNVAAPSLAVVIQAGGVSPGLTTFNNSAVDYSVSGGTIGGTGGLTKLGTGTVTLASANTYTGATSITGGIVVMGNAASMGATSGVTLNGATLDIATAGSDTAYNFTINSGNISTIVSNVASGTVGINHTMGTLTMGGSVAAGGTQLNITKGVPIASGTPTITFSGMTMSGATNAITTLNPTTAGMLIGTVTASNNAKTLNLDGTNTGNQVTGIISNGTGISITKTNSSTWTLGGANTYTGATTVSAGTLTLSGNRTVSTAATTGTYTVAGAGTQTLNIQNGTYGIGGSFLVGSDGGTATVAHSAGTITSVGGSGLIMGNGSVAGTTAIYNLSGTGSLTVASVIMGTNAGFSAASPNTSTITMSSTGALTTTTLRIGRYDNAAQVNTTNTFNQTAGTTTITTLGLGGSSANAANSTGPVIANLNLTGGSFSATTIASLSAGGAASALNANSSVINIGGTAQVTLGAFPTFRGTNSTATITFDTTTAGIGFLSPAAASAVYMPAGTFTNAYLTANGANFNVPTSKDITIGQLLENATAQVGTLTKSGVGTLTLTGASTYTGATTISASGGTLQLGNGGTLGSLSTSSAISVGTGATFAVNQSDTVTQGTDFSNAAITGNGGFRQSGTGTTVLNLANGYLGGTAVNVGTLQLAFGGVASDIISASSALTLSGGSLQLTGTGTQTLASLTTTASTASSILLGTNETLTFTNGVITIGSGSSLNFNTAAGGANGAAVGSGLVVLTSSGYTPGTAINTSLTVTDAGGFGLATVNGSDQVIRLTGSTLLPAFGATSATNYLVDNNAGGIAADGSSSLEVTSSQSAQSITVDSTTANGVLTLNSGVVLSTNTWNFGGTGSNTYQITGNTGGAGLNSVASNDAITLNNYNPGVVTFDSPILANGVNNLFVGGTGTTVLTGLNTYTGTTTISGGGTLQIGSAGQLNGGTYSAGISIGTGSTLRYSSSSAQTLSGVISGAGWLTKDGASTLTSSVFNTFTGPITINGGELSFTASATGSNNVYLSTQININGASTLRIGNTTGNIPIYDGRNYTFDATGGGSILVGTGNYNAASTPFSITTLGGARDTIGLITTSGAFGFNLGSTVATFNVALGSDASSDLTVTPIIANTGSILKTGTGRLTLTGANTYTGITTINAGTLRVSGGAAIVNAGLIALANAAGATFQVVGSETIGALTGGGATGGAVSIDASQTLSLSSGTHTYAGTVSGAGILTNAGAIQTLNGVLSHTGGVNVTTGTLTLGNSGNTYTGTTAISAAAAGIIVTANGALGAIGVGNETTVGANGVLGFSGGITYSTLEKIIGSGVGNTAVNSPAGFAANQRGFIQSVSGSNTFAGDIEVNAAGLSRIGTQDGASLTLTGAITQAAGNLLFRVGNNAGDFVTLSNAGNIFAGNSTVFTNLATPGTYAGVRLGIDNGLPTNRTISGFDATTGAGTALNLAGYDQTLNGLITGIGGLSIINTDTGNASTLTLSPTADQTTTNTLVLGGVGLGVINVVKNGAFTQTFSGLNTYTGTTAVSAGTLSINTIANVGAVSSAIGAPTTAAAGLITLGSAATTGTLRYTGIAQSTDRTIQIGANSLTPAVTDTGGATIEANGASNAALTFSAATFNTQTDATTGVGADRTLTLQGTSTGANTISGIIQDNLVTGAGTGTATVALAKAGAGTWTLSGVNTYTGGTTVSDGKLVLSNNNAAGAGDIAVSGASAILEISTANTLANNITVSNATASVVHGVAAAGTYSTGTTGVLKSQFIGGQADTTAGILDGTNSSATEATLTMLFKDTSVATNDAIRRSDVFDVSGTTGTDTYVIQLSTSVALAADSVLGWLNGSNEWVNAVTGNTGGTANFIAGAWNNTFTLGTYGYDSAGTGKVWAVVNHSGAFAAVPEPTSALVGLLIGAGLLRRRRH